MSVAFATGVANPHGSVAQGALLESLVASPPAPLGSASLRGADSTRTEPSTSALACGAAAGVALVSLKGLKRQGRSRHHKGTSRFELVPRHAVAAAAPVAATAEDELETVPSKDKTADGRLWLGLEVKWNGKQGVVRYIGETKFASGEWVGVEMIEAKGMHDGTVMGVPYFICPPQMGIFAAPAQLQTGGTADAAVLEQTMRQAEAASPSPVASAPAPSAAAAHGEDEEIETLPSNEKTADGSISLGQRVAFSGKQGTVRYIGPLKFTAGEWLGVELDEAKGMHNGSVLGVPYFVCAPKSGIFAQQAQLQAGGAAAPAAPPAAAPAAPSAPAPVVAPTPVTAPPADDDGIETLPSQEKTADGSISLGQAVTWSGKQGTVRYIGSAKFAGGEWIGVELTEAAGMHDGSVLSVPYFVCAPKFGVMAQQAQLQAGAAPTPAPAAAAPAVAPQAAAPATPAAPAPAPTPTPTASAGPEDDEAPETLPSQEKTADGSISLGQAVTWNGKQGTVRYIGPVKFAGGEFIGVELSDATGMHDGNVLGVPYFACPPKCGVMAQQAQLQTGAAPAAAPAAAAPAAAPVAAAPVAAAPAAPAAPTPAVAPTPVAVPSPSVAYASSETPSSQAKTANGSFSLGQTVSWFGKQGTVRYIGPVVFGEGEWVGVELIEATGMHDGIVMGTPYFKCAPRCGIFSLPENLRAGGAAVAAPPRPAAVPKPAAAAPAAAPTAPPPAAKASTPAAKPAAADEASSSSSPSFDPKAQVGAIAPLGFFDPLGFSKEGDETAFNNFRTSELKHGRVAMLASVGLVAQHFVRIPGFEKAPSGVLAPLTIRGAAGMLSLVVLASFAEVGGMTNPFSPKEVDEDLRNKEIENGRFAMIATMGILAAEFATGKDGAQQLGFP